MIRVPEVRVIDNEGEQLGIMETEKALALAEERGLDLVEVSPTARPPVCRIVDYGKYKYEANKKQRQSKKKQHTVQVKEIKLRPKIEEHDFQFKKRHAVEFLEASDKVKFTVIFRGRELDHKENGAKLLKRMIEELKDIGVVERPAMFEGRLMTMYMGPAATVPPPKKKQSAPKSGDKKEKKKETAPAASEPAEAKAEKVEAAPAASKPAKAEAEKVEAAPAASKPAKAEAEKVEAAPAAGKSPEAEPAAKKEDQDA